MTTLVTFLACSLWLADEAAIRRAVEAQIAPAQQAAPPGLAYDVLFPPNTKLVAILQRGETLQLSFTKALGERPWSRADADKLREALLRGVVAVARDVKQLEIAIDGKPLGQFVTDRDQIRVRQHERRLPLPVIEPALAREADAFWTPPTNGLHGRHLMIGASHGWTYNKQGKWAWQRPRVFTTVEDLLPWSFITPFLIPMLENAGAVVFSARERDLQTTEVIVDNDAPECAFTTRGAWRTAQGTGWKGGRSHRLDDQTEPFTLGTTLESADPNARATFAAEIPKLGQYGVYVSWSAGPERGPAVYAVHHLGGVTRFVANQRIGGGTWIYFGRFWFSDQTRAEVEVSRPPGGTGTLSVDAVRFGGGMGNIAHPAGDVSKHPRYAESARYWTQYAGAPADLVFRMASGDHWFGPDYNRDIMARGEFANWLSGAPNGPNRRRDHPGLGVPIDAVLAWHTDAGYSRDGLTGTLSIYRIEDEIGHDRFPDGRTRWLNRDLSALIQNEICNSVRKQYTSSWRRRMLWTGNYGEIRRPNVPSTLLELLSHENFNDMKYALDPAFRRDVSRAVYKGLLRFIAYSNGFEPVIAPLPPTHVACLLQDSGKLRVSWSMQVDPLEPSANPTRFVVEESNDGRGFAPIARVKAAELELASPSDQCYYRILAVNAGGVSFPSRVVGACIRPFSRNLILIVDGYDRLAGPAIIDTPTRAGFDRTLDPGVGFEFHHGVAGNQTGIFPRADRKDAKKDAPKNPDGPRFGATTEELEDLLLPGNTFDHIAAHGRAWNLALQSFHSMTADAFEANLRYGRATDIDWIAGLQRTTLPPATHPSQTMGLPDRMQPRHQVFTLASRTRLRDFVQSGGRLIVSGAYVGDDLLNGPLADRQSRSFAHEVLNIASALHRRPGFRNLTLTFSTKLNPRELNTRPIEVSVSLGDRLRWMVEPGELYVVKPDKLREPPLVALDKPPDPALAAPRAIAVQARDRQRTIVFGFQPASVPSDEDRSKLLKEARLWLGQ